LVWEGVNGQNCSLLSPNALRIVWTMGLPANPITLTVEQIEDLNRRLSTLRHDINGDLALIVAAAELIKLNPDLKEKMLTTLLEQPPKIRERADKFSTEFEKILGITRP